MAEEYTPEQLLEEMAIRLCTLVANPNSAPARAAAKRSLGMWRAWKRRRELGPIADAADAEVEQQPGYRRDIDG